MREPLIASSDIKKINHTKIFRLIYASPEGISKQEIMKQLGLSLPTVTQKLQELQEEGLVQDSGSVGSSVGRRARVFSVVREAKLAAGLDINENYFTAVLVDLYGNVICSEKHAVSFSRTDAYYKEMGQAVLRLIQAAGVSHEKILGVGLGVPGLVTKDRRKIFCGKILDFEGAASTEFSKYIPFPCLFYNDAKAAGFAELWNRDDITRAFYVLLSNHVGGAMIYNHEVDLGENTHAGEIGHMTLIPAGKQCYCGRLGCVDPYCSASVLSAAAGGSLEEFFRLLRQGNAGIQEVWDEYVQFLALAVNNAGVLLDCPIILGGYLGAYIEEYIGQIRERAQKRNPFSSREDTIIACRYKVEAIAAGAALPFIDEFLNTI